MESENKENAFWAGTKVTNHLYPLSFYDNLVSKTILEFQQPVTGLLPASLSFNQGVLEMKGNDASDAWVRDNVYSILAVWGLALAYRKNPDADDDRARALELEQRVVKLMRALMMAMMRQVDKVERFKRTQLTADSLHAKYSISTLSAVVGDLEWGHLQIDATSLYLLMLAQMTAAGLRIIFTFDEVTFIQNLVFYIETAYRIPDFGIWERGEKTNLGPPELNTSSIGMAKAALEAMSELDLFGSKGGPKSTIHVQADQIQHCKAVLQSMLPKESNSKEIGASLLSIISFPAFAVEDTNLVSLTKKEIITKLQGKYGLCRFLRDGYKTKREDPNRLHYDSTELHMFENIECEWPLFFVYLLLDGLFNNIPTQVDEYWQKLEKVTFKAGNDLILLPELYYVPQDKLDLECKMPHSQKRHYGDHLPHLWGQSLYILACLIYDNYIAVGELDPLNLRYATTPRPDLVIQVAFIAEDEQIKDLLTGTGICCQTREEAAPLQIFPAQCLGQFYTHLGKNEKLGLSGRTFQSIGLVGSAGLYRIKDTIIAFPPAFLDYHQFYFCLDNELSVDALKMHFDYLRANWRMLGRPTITIPITHFLLEDSLSSPLGKLILQISSGYVYDIRVHVGLLGNLLTTSCLHQFDFISENKLVELISKFSNLIMSPPPGEMLKSRIDDHGHFIPKTFKNVGDHGTAVEGSVLRSRRLSRTHSLDTDPLISSNMQPQHFTEVTFDFFDNRIEHSEYNEVTIDEIKQLLESTDSVIYQADILHYLYITQGLDFDVGLYGMKGCTVHLLLKDLYEKVCHYKYWSLIRHTAGMLGKQIDTLGEATVDILLRQKQLSVGLPDMGNEQDISHQYNPEDLKQLVYNSCGDDSSTAVLIQEILVYLAMFIKTEPQLFKEMLRIRIGLIVEIMAAEHASSHGLSGEEAADHFMNMSPFQMKYLLYCILSGKEEDISSEETDSSSNRDRNKAALKHVHQDMQRMCYLGNAEEALAMSAGCNFETGERYGQWLRRRCLDGALNRAPVDFYPQLWKALEKFWGISISGYVLHHNIVKEMTPGELKFAFCVESALNSIPHPEYRQLMVETLVILSKIIESHKDLNCRFVIRMDDIIQKANDLFLEHQREYDGDATICCAGKGTEKCGASYGICRHFYDSAPGGSNGTMRYFTQVLLKTLYGPISDENNNCIVG